MRIKLILLLIICGNFTISAQETKRPKLIVGIVVDQMRYDYLTKFYNDFGEDGFKRLLREGLNCKNVNYSYKPTYTGPGHATIFTGTTPSVHGIVGNNWYERSTKKSVYCSSLADSSTTSFSPKRLLVETFADGMKQFSNFKSKSFGVSLKDRGAILPAGHLADGAYWFDSELGIWVSDEYYFKNNPAWLQEFNGSDFSALYLKEGWTLSKSIAEYSESLPDTSAYEFSLTSNSKTTFPYNLVQAQKKSDWGILKKVPQGNQMSADLFKVLIEKESIGKDEFTDFVSLSFSATDYVGHRFGVQSVEVHDTYIKLDQTIADLLKFLDDNIGKEEYTLFLTSDHGAGMPRAYLKEKGLPNGELNQRDILKSLRTIAESEKLSKEWIEKVTNLNVYFNDSMKFAENEVYHVLKAKCLIWLNQQNGIARVVDVEITAASDDEREQMALRGFHPKRSGDLILIEEANWTTYTDKGSTHGSPYEYDTHVPLLFYGVGITKGVDITEYPVTSIVPSLSILFGFQTNQISHGPIIKDLFKK